MVNEIMLKSKIRNTNEINTTSQFKQKLKLEPKVHPVVNRFLGESVLPHELIRALGSPLNLVFPSLIRNNIDAFDRVFAKHSIQGHIFFAHKSSQSSSLVSQIAAEGIGVDVSSSQELKHSLSCGVKSNRMEATGPKGQQFLLLCLQHELIINVDNINELERILALRRSFNFKDPARILLRLSGFKPTAVGSINKASRFGIPILQLDKSLTFIATHREDFDLLGFAFHLTSTAPLEKVLAIEQCLELIEKSIENGFDIRVLNIGGGFKVRYLEDTEDWNHYSSELKQSILGTGGRMSWNDNTFGLTIHEGKIRGDLHTYNFADTNAGSLFLDDILSHELSAWNHQTVGSILSQNMIELWIEPGRSLVDQCGITLAKVSLIRESSQGDLMVGLHMKRQDIVFNDQEIFVDPIILYQDERAQGASMQLPVYFSGNLCLATDLIYRHATFLNQLPQEGDVVAFINTAGYSMDFSASKTCMQPIARKVAIVPKENTFFWFDDDQYSALASM